MVRTAGLEPAWAIARGIFVPATAFAAAPQPAAGRLWSGLYLRPCECFRRCPSSLYTFLENQAWLGIAM